MNRCNVCLPAYTIGHGVTNELAERLDGLRIALVSGVKSWEAARDRLPRLTCCAHHFYGGECTAETIEAAARTAGEADARAIFGIGGGKALDVAKGAGYRLGLPVYTLPTIAATCAAVTKLSIVYHADGTLDSFWFLDRPPVHATLDTALLASAPARYLRAGIGDTIAKGLEPAFASRGDAPNHSSRLGLSISRMCVEPMLAAGAAAYADNLAGKSTDAFAETLLGIIVSTGLVSLLVDEDYNGAIAHSVCYGLDSLEGVASRALHGELVGYGCLVQLALDRQRPERPKEHDGLLERVRTFLQSLGMPVTLSDLGVRCDAKTLATALREAITAPDMAHLPYAVTTEMLFDAMEAVETM